MHAAGRIGIRDDRGLSPSKDPGLFGAYALARIAEIIHVIERNGGQQRAIAVEGVDRVQASAEADLQYRGVERLGRENHPGSQGTELEVRELSIASGALDRFERFA